MSRKNTAGSTITDLVPVFPREDPMGAQPPTFPFPELGAETFIQGQGVQFSGLQGGGRIGITALGGNTSGGILGFAADAAAGRTSNFCGVWVALDSTVFVANVGHSATSAAAQTAANDLGAWYGLTTLSGRTYVDKNIGGSGAAAAARVVGLYQQDDVPCFYGRVLFTVNQQIAQFSNYNVSGNPVQ